MNSLHDKLIALIVEAVVSVEQSGIQPTARQVSRALGMHDGFAKVALLVAVESGALSTQREFIEQAAGVFTVYRSIPAVRVC